MDPGNLGPYRILRRLGSGGMGTVYLAEDTRLGRQVAVKVLPAAAHPGELSRFLREAKTAAALKHPNIAVLFDVGEDGGTSYLVMEQVEGQTLRQAISIEPLSWERALDIFAQLASALGHAHELGVLHRDIKPGNIMLSPERGAVLLDFGVAEWIHFRPSSGSDSTQRPTETVFSGSGGVVGTACYMSPEQLTGEPLDGRSDLFQLGMVLYEAVSGRHPFEGPTAVDIQHAVLRSKPTPLGEIAEVPDEFSRIAGKLLEKEPDYRYPDARAVEVDLRALRRDSTSDAVRPYAGGLRARRRRLPVWMMAVPAVLGVAVVGAALTWWVKRPPPSVPVPSRLVALTHGEGNDSDPFFSPDGKNVAFASDRGGNWDLWVTLVSGGSPVQITDSEEVEIQPTYAPDGSRLAFVRRRYGATSFDIFVMPALGGDARKLLSDASDPQWSPDGRWIAFADRSGGWARIAKIAVDGRSEPIAVTETEQGFFHRRPAWSPDGKTIFYNRSPGGWAGQLMRVSSDGGTPRQLTDDPDGVANISATTTPDGRWVVHVSDRGGAVNLWRIGVEGGDPERITSGAGRDLNPDVSPDGSRIVFVSEPASYSVVAVSAADGSQRVLAEVSGSTAWSPTLSPDGSKLAFSRKLPGKPWEVVQMSAEGGPVSSVVDDLSVFWARFLPDGRSLIFHTRAAGGGRIGTVGLDGAGLTWLTGEEEDATYPDVSADGEYLAFVRQSADQQEIVVRSLSGGPDRVVAGNATLPCFSPDGKRLAMARSRSYLGGIAVLDLDGGEPRWVTSSGSWPTWMPDGTGVAYADAGPEGQQRAWIVPAEGGPSRPLGTYRWEGVHYPFVVDPVSGDLITTTPSGGKSTLWIAEYGVRAGL